MVLSIPETSVSMLVTMQLYTKMFPDSEIAQKFSCGRTHCTAIVKEALAPNYNTMLK